MEARALLLAGAPLVPAGAGAALVLDEDDGLGALVGTPRAPELRDATVTSGVVHLLVQEETCEVAQRAVPGWQCERAWLHTLPDGAIASWPQVHDDVRVLPVDSLAPAGVDRQAGRERAGDMLANLAHLSSDMRLELLRASRWSPLFCAEAEGMLVSFAYGASITETLVDISIDTLHPWRGRGHGAAAARALVRWIVDTGRRPVWGALDSNAASKRLAAKLGFQVCGSVFVLSRDRRP